MSKSFNSRTTSDAQTENIQTLTGQRGDGMSRAVLVSDLKDLGLAEVTAGRGGQAVVKPGVSAGSSSGVVVQNPQTPKNLRIDSAFSFVVLSWDKPTYTGHATTEIWRSSDDNLANAVVIGSTVANVYSDQQSTGTSGFYYWIRFVNKNDKPSPYNSTSGTFGKTDPDAAQNLVADRVVAGIEVITPTLRSATIDNGQFQVDANGNARFGDLVNISAGGQLIIQSYTGSAGGSMQITNNRIVVRDGNNVARVVMGNLDGI